MNRITAPADTRAMNSDDTLSSFTASQLTLSRANDFAALAGLQAQFTGQPDPAWYALRNFSAHVPRSMNLALIEKAAVAVMTSTDTTAAGPLAIVQPLAEGFIQLVRSSSLLGRLKLRRVPLNASLPVETGGCTFVWVGENKPKQLSAGSYTTVSLLRRNVRALLP
jgi:hypothetical protein